MSTVIKDLGAVSAYAYAVEKGYTGTEAEFAELMADYAEVGQRAEDAAESALNSKTAAQTAATTATNKATEATTAATTATTKAGEASTSASTATSAKDTAVSASQTATTKATEATTAAATATSAKTDAVAANTAAQSAKTAAQTAQTGAETAAASVSASAAQIATNTENISQLMSDLTVLGDLIGVQIVEVTNLLGNHGNFEDFSLSATNWYKAYNESTASVTDNVLTFNANRQFGSLRHVFNAVADHKYYFFGTIKSDSPSVSISINVDNPIVNPIGDNTFEYLSGIFTASSTGSKSFAIVDSRSITGTIYAEKCGVIDLTDCFGVGQEPTKDQMDEAMHKIGDFIVNGVLSFVLSTAKAYENKKILFMGDSITAANLNNNGWCKYFNEIMNPSKSVNVAVSGATWSDNEDTVYDGNPSTYNQTNNTIGNQVEKIARGKDTSNPNYSHVANYDSFDIIIISAGTNDGNSKFDISFFRDSLVDTWANPISYESINTKNAVGAMAYAYERLYTMYPDAEFYYCTPIQAYPAKKTWGSIQNKGSVIKEFGGYIPVTIIDTEKCGIFGNHEKYSTEGVDLYDGLHPNAHGAQKMGVYNANAIIQTYLAKMTH